MGTDKSNKFESGHPDLAPVVLFAVLKSPPDVLVPARGILVSLDQSCSTLVDMLALMHGIPTNEMMTRFTLSDEQHVMFLRKRPNTLRQIGLLAGILLVSNGGSQPSGIVQLFKSLVRPSRETQLKESKDADFGRDSSHVKYKQPPLRFKGARDDTGAPSHGHGFGETGGTRDVAIGSDLPAVSRPSLGPLHSTNPLALFGQKLQTQLRKGINVLLFGSEPRSIKERVPSDV